MSVNINIEQYVYDEKQLGWCRKSVSKNHTSKKNKNIDLNEIKFPIVEYFENKNELKKLREKVKKLEAENKKLKIGNHKKESNQKQNV